MPCRTSIIGMNSRPFTSDANGNIIQCPLVMVILLDNFGNGQIGYRSGSWIISWWFKMQISMHVKFAIDSRLFQKFLHDANNFTRQVSSACKCNNRRSVVLWSENDNCIYVYYYSTFKMNMLVYTNI